MSDTELNQIVNSLKTAVTIAKEKEDISSQRVEAIQVPLQALIREQESRRFKRIAKPTVSLVGTHLLFWLASRYPSPFLACPHRPLPQIPLGSGDVFLESLGASYCWSWLRGSCPGVDSVSAG